VLFKEIDFLSPEITLFHLGKKNYFSIFSIILSIILIIILIIFSMIFSLDLIKRKDLVAYSSKTWENDIGTFLLDDNSYFHFLTIYSQIYPYSDEYNSSLINFLGIINYNRSMIQKEEINNFSHWIYDICDENELNRKKEYNNYTDYNFTRLCIKYYFNNETKNYYYYTDKEFIWPNVSGGIENPNFTTYSIVMTKCFENEYLNITNCYDGNPKNQSVQSFTINLTYYEAIVELSNYKTPIKHRLKTLQLSLTKSFIFSSNITMTPVKFSSNDGIILDNERFYQGQKFKSNKIGYSYETNLNLYGAISILLENDEEIYFRNYKKLQSIIGYIGGFYQFFLLLFKLINSFIYYDFQIVDDFNKMIENRISKYFHKQYTSKMDESLSNLYKRSKSNVLDKNKYNNNKIINNFINQSKNNNSIYQLRSQESIYEKLSKNYRKVSWRNLIFYKCICSKSFNVGYMDIIIKKRSKLLSEEAIFKMNITLKLLYENHIDKKSILIPKK
jgi:hypothetical protein